MGICEAVEKGTGIKMRAEPLSTEIARLIPLRDKDAEMAIMGANPYNAATRSLSPFEEWEPQRLRLIWRGGNMAGGMAVKGDSSIQTIYDLKGKRVAWIAGSIAQNLDFTTWLAFAGLNWDDVEKVTYPSIVASWRGVMEGAVDVAPGSAMASFFNEMAASPGGLRWIPIPAADKEGWERMSKKAEEIGAVQVPVSVGRGPGIDPDKPLETTGFPVCIIGYDFLEEI